MHLIAFICNLDDQYCFYFKMRRPWNIRLLLLFCRPTDPKQSSWLPAQQKIKLPSLYMTWYISEVCCINSLFSTFFFKVGKKLLKINNKDTRTRFIKVFLVSLLLILNRYLLLRVGFKPQALGTNYSHRKSEFLHCVAIERPIQDAVKHLRWCFFAKKVIIWKLFTIYPKKFLHRCLTW